MTSRFGSFDSAIVRRASNSVTSRNANVVFPLPGVAATRKSRGSCTKYASSASFCHALSLSAVPRAARSGNAGDRCSAADVPTAGPNDKGMLT